MTDETRDELLLLERARQGFAPKPGAAERILYNTRTAIAAGGAVADAASAHTLGAKLQARVSGSLSGAGLASKLAFVLSVLGAGAVGYGFGRDAGMQAAHRAAPPASAAHEVAAIKTAPIELAPARPTPDVGTAVAPESVKSQQRSKARADAGVSRKAVRAAGEETIEPSASERTADALAEPPSLQIELAALKRIERALRDHQPARAEELLTELDAVVPNGRMLEERAAARAMTRCATVLESERAAMQVVLRFSREHPASVYFRRVRETCLAPWTDSIER